MTKVVDMYDLSVASTKTKYIKLNTKTQNIFLSLKWKFDDFSIHFNKIFVYLLSEFFHKVKASIEVKIHHKMPIDLITIKTLKPCKKNSKSK